MFWKNGNILVVQKGWEYANSFTFTDNDYTIESEIVRSNKEWENLGFEMINKEEFEKMFFDAGFSELPEF